MLKKRPRTTLCDWCGQQRTQSYCLMEPARRERRSQVVFQGSVSLERSVVESTGRRHCRNNTSSVTEAFDAKKKMSSGATTLIFIVDVLDTVISFVMRPKTSWNVAVLLTRHSANQFSRMSMSHSCCSEKKSPGASGWHPFQVIPFDLVPNCQACGRYDHTVATGKMKRASDFAG